MSAENKNESLNELHLFAGVGGGILGGMLLGHRCVCAVEINEYRRKVLLQRQRDGILPKFPIWDDVRTFDGKPWRTRVDLIEAGWPCDDISPAGQKSGIDGKESALFAEIPRITDEIRPRYLRLENSGRLIHDGLARVLSELAKLGYDARWCRLGASHIGADHERLRTWIVAYPYGGERALAWDFSRGRRFVQQVSSNLVGTAINQPWIMGRNNGLAHRMDRLAAIGSGQVPSVVKLAWQVLSQ